MKGDAIELDLDAGLDSLEVELATSDEVKKCTYDLIGSLLDQMNKGYGDFAQEDKKSETLKFYRKMKELHLKLSKCGRSKVDVVSHLDNIALEINKFIKVLEKQKSRPFGKSLLANKKSIKELKCVTKTLLDSRTTIMTSCTGEVDSAKLKDMKLNLSSYIDEIKQAKYISDVKLGTLLFNLLKEINKGYGDISQTDKKSETLKFYRELQKLYSKTLKLKTMNRKIVDHTSQELKDVVTVIDETALEINKFIKVLEKQKSRPSGKSKLANKESIATLKDISGALKTARNLKWEDTNETKKAYAKIYESISELNAPVKKFKDLLDKYEGQLTEVNGYEDLRQLLENCRTSLRNFSEDIKKKYNDSST